MVRTAFVIAALGWGLLAGAPARADIIFWTYDWSSTPGIIKSNNGNSQVKIQTGDVHLAAGSTNLIAAALRTVSNAAAALPDRFTLRPYSLTLTIKDAESGISGAVTFT